MRKTLIPALLVLLAAAGLTACSPGGSGQVATTGPSQGSASSSPSASGTGTPSADAETTAPAPSPSTTAPTAGPGQGDAELAIMVKPSATGQAASYTLVCQKGIPAGESQHPTAAAACTALKDNAALLSPAPAPKDKVCTQQYGGAAEATVTGSVDGTAVEAKFSLRDGCEIAQWQAAKDVLGPTGGAV